MERDLSTLLEDSIKYLWDELSPAETEAGNVLKNVFFFFFVIRSLLNDVPSQFSDLCCRRGGYPRSLVHRKPKRNRRTMVGREKEVLEVKGRKRNSVESRLRGLVRCYMLPLLNGMWHLKRERTSLLKKGQLRPEETL